MVPDHSPMLYLFVVCAIKQHIPAANLKKNHSFSNKWRVKKVNYDQLVENDAAELIDKLREH